MIEKYVTTAFKVASSSDDNLKFAAADFQTFIPQAIQSFIDRLKSGAVDPRFVYFHVIAMTDGGAYGSNLNGDTFGADELLGIQSPEEAAKNPGQYQGQQLQRYKTFEQAKFFKHHDNSPISPFFGDVPVSDWNAPMKRVELIIRVARQQIPELGMQSGADTIARAAQNGYFCVSMGTRIAYEKCSICGNENEFTTQRCPHLAGMMNMILPDGRQVTASNHGVRFFDISDVEYNPADLTAMSLAKVAARGGSQSHINPSRDIEHTSPWRRKHSEIEKHMPADAVGALAPTSGETVEAVPEIPDEVIKKAVAEAGLDSFLSTATGMGIVLSPVEFMVAVEAADPVGVQDLDGKFAGFTLDLDNLSSSAYDALAPMIPSRSGFAAACAAAGWEPAKIAACGFRNEADLYSYYRAELAALSINQFDKVACSRLLLRDLALSPTSSFDSVHHHLAYAGFSH